MGQQAGAGAGAGAATDPAAAAAAGQAGAAGTQQPGAAAGGVPGMPFDINSLASQGRWFGPLMALGGGALAIKGFSSSAAAQALTAAGQTGVTKGSGLWKWGGIGLALGGLALTGIGFKAKGIDTGKKATEAEAVAAINQLTAQYEQTMATLQQQAQTEIQSLQQQVAAAQQGAGAGTQGTGTGAGQPQIDPQTGQPIPGTQAGQTGSTTPGAPAIDPQTGEPIPGTGTPVGVGAAATTVPGAGQLPTAGTQGTGAATPGAWSAQSLLGRSVQLAAGNSASGTVIADPGAYRIEANAGDPNGYATLDEANNAARQTMSTELMGSKFLRWMVVEHGGRYYGVIAKQQGAQDQAQPLDAATGNVVAWSAMNHVTDNGQNGWQAYTWSQTGGAQAFAVPYGTTAVFANGAVGASTGGGATGGTGSAPVGGGSVTGGGAVTGGAGTAFNPQNEIGRSFSINAATTAEGDIARGGELQLQKFVASSSGGFGTAEQAAQVARAAREAAGGGNQWQRWVTMQGSDGRFYVYEGSIVARSTAQLQAAAPVSVFGSGFGEFFDGATSSWQAVRA